MLARSQPLPKGAKKNRDSRPVAPRVVGISIQDVVACEYWVNFPQPIIGLELAISSSTPIKLKKKISNIDMCLSWYETNNPIVYWQLPSRA
jgi:hypothetical protein